MTCKQEGKSSGSVLAFGPPARNPFNHPTTFGYDIKGNLTTIINVLNKTTIITVDNQGQPLTIKDPLTRETMNPSASPCGPV